MIAPGRLLRLLVVAAAVLSAASSGLAQSAAELADPVKMRALERADTMPATDFFDVRLTPGRAGTLLRAAKTAGFDLPPGATATRILYRSRAADGRTSLASATVVTPPGAAPAGGWPTVVWAHGTTGVARQCGPSVTRSLGYYVPTLLAQKFGVVVVDYAGLSTPGGHHYMSARDNGEDVINAVPAARAAVPSLSRGWVTIGHSQGGLAVWAAANLEARRHDPTYLGGIALAPAVGGARLAESVGAHKGQTLYALYLAYSVKLQSPSFDVSRMLTPAAMRHYDEVTTKGCWFIANALFTEAPAGSVLRKGWRNDPAVKRFFAPSFVARSAIDRPLLVGTGAADDAVPPALVAPVVAQQQALGGPLTYHVYPGDHETMLESSFADQVRFIRDRFAAAR